MVEKVTLTKTLDGYAAKKGEFRVLEIPPQRYLMIDGHGDPNSSPQFAEAVESLYPVAYTVKFASKNALGRDYVVPPLEGRWWAADMSTFTTARDKSQWDWTMMLLVPEWIADDLVRDALSAVGAKKKRPPRLQDVRVETLDEGLCIQTLHVGAFDDEATLLEYLHGTEIPDRGLQLSGIHHEIYLTDFRRSAPEKQRTILRQPVTRIA